MISGPCGPINTVCSNCADSAPSAVRTVQPSASVRTAAVPALIIGSIVNAMPSRKRCPGVRTADVRDVRIHVHRAADAVAAVGLDDAAGGADVARDRGADVAEPPAGHRRRDARIAGAAGQLDEGTRVRRGIADHERRRGVAVVAVELGRDVDVDDVAVHQADVRARHAVAHDVVAADAHRGGEAVVAELRRPAALRLGVRADQAIDLRRRHPGREPRTDVRQGRGRRATRAPHAIALDGRQDRDRHAGTVRSAVAAVQYLFGLDACRNLRHDRRR